VTTAALTRQQHEHLPKTAVVNRRIDELPHETTAYRVQREHHEAALLLDATLTGQEIEECYGYRVRLDKGCTSTSGDADDFDKLSGAGLWQIAGMLPPEEGGDDDG